MHINLYTQKRWFDVVSHRWDGMKFFYKKDQYLIIRLGFITFGCGKYFATTKECFEKDKMMKPISDTQILNWLQRQNDKASYTGLCEFRWSATNRGWRLHESKNGGKDVRKAIIHQMKLSERSEL